MDEELVMRDEPKVGLRCPTGANLDPTKGVGRFRRQDNGHGCRNSPRSVSWLQGYSAIYNTSLCISIVCKGFYPSSDVNYTSRNLARPIQPSSPNGPRDPTSRIDCSSVGRDVTGGASTSMVHESA
ncbi:hypothetical protein VNO77_39182 [Canavalia gladiata]|uniref:Uncharacterized protein n=1 Tax=Canavalia gladiata TaxID=3824 RepID=A0AAN9KA11_CANGL